MVRRWDSPFIITTSARFFESLFSAHPKDCRKLHNIAQSVILFDEAQSLSANLATATMRAVRALCGDYGCSIVFSTATQPDFSALPDLDNWQPREILSCGERYYSALKRTRVRWPLERPTALEDIADKMAQKDSVRAIVNLRRHAVRLFEALKAACPNNARNSLFFLTTDLCPKPRSEIIDTIKDDSSKASPAASWQLSASRPAWIWILRPCTAPSRLWRPSFRRQDAATATAPFPAADL